MAQDSTHFEDIQVKVLGVFGALHINPGMVFHQNEKWKFVLGASLAKSYQAPHFIGMGLTGNLYRTRLFNRFSLEYGPQIEIGSSNWKFAVDSTRRNLNSVGLGLLLDVLLKYRVNRKTRIFLGNSFGGYYYQSDVYYPNRSIRYQKASAFFHNSYSYIGCSFKF